MMARRLIFRLLLVLGALGLLLGLLLAASSHPSSPIRAIGGGPATEVAARVLSAAIGNGTIDALAAGVGNASAVAAENLGRWTTAVAAAVTGGESRTLADAAAAIATDAAAPCKLEGRFSALSAGRVPAAAAHAADAPALQLRTFDFWQLHDGSWPASASVRADPPDPAAARRQLQQSDSESAVVTAGDVEAADAGGSDAGGFRVQIVDGSVYILHERGGYDSRHPSMKLFLAVLASQHDQRLPDVDFYLSATDRPQAHRAAFSYCCLQRPPADRGAAAEALRALQEAAGAGSEPAGPDLPPDRPREACAAFPDFTILSWPEVRNESYSGTMALIAASARAQPYERRAERLFWRGAGNNARRDAFAALSDAQPGLFDVRMMR